MEILLGDSSNSFLLYNGTLLCELIYDEFTKVFPKNPNKRKNAGKKGSFPAVKAYAFTTSILPFFKTTFR